MNRVIPVGQQAVDQFPAFELDGWNKRSGLLQSDFDVDFYRDGNEVSPSFSISEVNGTGEYRITWTPDQKGYWVLDVYAPFNGEIWTQEYDAGQTFIELPQILSQYPVYEYDNHTKKSGLIQTDFNVTLYVNGAVSNQPVTITEIGSTGEYLATWTPDRVGFWVLEVAIPYNQQIWTAEYGIGPDYYIVVYSQFTSLNAELAITDELEVELVQVGAIQSYVTSQGLQVTLRILDTLTGELATETLESVLTFC